MTTTKETHTKRALYTPKLCFWLAADFLSLFGDQVYFLTLSWAAIKAGGPAAAGMVLVCAAIPRGALMLLGGLVVDRFGARRTAVASDVVRATVMLGCLMAPSQVPLSGLIVLALFFGAIDALFYPASGALSAAVVERDQLARLQGVRALTMRGSVVIGAPVGGIILGLGGASLAFGVNALTFLVSAAALLLIPLRYAPERRAERPFKEAAAGLRAVANSPTIWIPLLALALFEFTTNGVSNVGLPSLADKHAWGAEGFGYLFGSLGLGASLVASYFAFTGRALNYRIGVISAALISALALLGLAGTPDLVAAICGTFCIGLAGGLMFGTVMPHLQRSANPENMGQMMSLISLSTVGITPLSKGAAAAAVEGAGTTLTFVGSATLIAALAAIAFVILPRRLPQVLPNTGDGTHAQETRP